MKTLKVQDKNSFQIPAYNNCNTPRPFLKQRFSANNSDSVSIGNASAEQDPILAFNILRKESEEILGEAGSSAGENAQMKRNRNEFNFP